MAVRCALATRSFSVVFVTFRTGVSTTGNGRITTCTAAPNGTFTHTTTGPSTITPSPIFLPPLLTFPPLILTTPPTSPSHPSAPPGLTTSLPRFAPLPPHSLTPLPSPLQIPLSLPLLPQGGGRRAVLPFPQGGGEEWRTALQHEAHGGVLHG
ncbi:unnamed protein product [Closterium sp. NIES-54]